MEGYGIAVHLAGHPRAADGAELDADGCAHAESQADRQARIGDHAVSAGGESPRSDSNHPQPIDPAGTQHRAEVSTRRLDQTLEDAVAADQRELGEAGGAGGGRAAVQE